MEWYYDIFKVLSLVAVWAIPTALIAVVVLFVVASPVLAVGGLVTRLYGFFHAGLPSRVQAERRGLNLACSIDTDCPPGFVCANGRCVPEKA